MRGDEGVACRDWCYDDAGAADNTRVALHFANAAKRVTMQPHVNEVVNQKALLRKLRDEVALLRKQLVSMHVIKQSCSAAAPTSMDGY